MADGVSSPLWPNRLVPHPPARVHLVHPLDSPVTLRQHPNMAGAIICDHCKKPIEGQPCRVPGSAAQLHRNCTKFVRDELAAKRREGLPRPVIWRKKTGHGGNSNTRVPAMMVDRHASGNVVLEIVVNGVTVRRNTPYDNVLDPDGKYIDA